MNKVRLDSCVKDVLAGTGESMYVHYFIFSKEENMQQFPCKKYFRYTLGTQYFTVFINCEGDGTLPTRKKKGA